jgi:ribulose-phosphate 3-epimerase
MPYGAFGNYQICPYFAPIYNNAYLSGMKMPIVAPSLLSADFGRLNEDIALLESSEAEWIHLDVMDGRFVPNISFGFPVLEVVRRQSKKTLDVHLMIEQPELYVERFAQGGADIITVHWEACRHLHRTLTQIRDLGKKAGVALNPHTPVKGLRSVLPYTDLILIMSVNPGFGGQKFIPEALSRVAEARAMVEEAGFSSILIEVDGGVGSNNAADLVRSGADVLVAGSSVFGASNPREAIRALRHLD